MFAQRDEDDETYYRHLNAVADVRPHIAMDDGADLIGVLHATRRELLDTVIAGTEETTTGVIRLRALEADGVLAFPVLAVNEAQTKHLFDNRYGTGQSTIDGIVRATNVLLAGREWIRGEFVLPRLRHLRLDPAPVIDVKPVVGVGMILRPRAILALRHRDDAVEIGRAHV